MFKAVVLRHLAEGGLSVASRATISNQVSTRKCRLCLTGTRRERPRAICKNHVSMCQTLDFAIWWMKRSIGFMQDFCTSHSLAASGPLVNFGKALSLH